MMKNLLNQAMHEIRLLRHENELLRAQVRVINIFDRAMGGASPGSMVGPDVLWELEQGLVKLEQERQAKVQPVAQYPREDKEPFKTEDDSRPKKDWMMNI